MLWYPAWVSRRSRSRTLALSSSAIRIRASVRSPTTLCLHVDQGLVHEGQHLSDVERLGQIFARPLIQEPFDLPRGGVGAQDHDGDPPGQRVGRQPGQDLAAVQIGYVKVEKDEVGAVVASQLEPAGSLHGGQERLRGPARHYPLQQSEVGEVVLDVE